MAYYVTVYCTKSLSPLTAEHLQGLVELQDFMTMAEDFLDRTEEYGMAVGGAVRVEPLEGLEGAFLLYYDPDDPDWCIRFDRHSGTEARDDGLAVAEELDGTQPGRIREVLSATEDCIAFELKSSELAGNGTIGFYICWYLAMALAEQGSGLVCMDSGAGPWWDPPDYSRPLFEQPS
jgi:hypothetical protein